MIDITMYLHHAYSCLDSLSLTPGFAAFSTHFSLLQVDLVENIFMLASNMLTKMTGIPTVAGGDAENSNAYVLRTCYVRTTL